MDIILDVVETLAATKPELKLRIKAVSYNDSALAVPVQRLWDWLESWWDHIPPSPIVNPTFLEQLPGLDAALVDDAQRLLMEARRGPVGRWLAWAVNEWHGGEPQEQLIEALLLHYLEELDRKGK